MNGNTDRLDRREFLRGAGFAGAAGLVGLRPDHSFAEPPPETSKIRLPQTPAMCEAPQYVVGDLLKAEGFTAVEYVRVDITNPNDPRSLEKSFASGAIDIGFHFAAQLVIQLDSEDPITLLAGDHVGCFELFGTDRIRAIRDLKGKTVAITRLGVVQHVYLASMVAYVGLDPQGCQLRRVPSRRRQTPPLGREGGDELPDGSRPTLLTYDTIRGHAGAITVAVPTVANWIRTALVTPSSETTRALPLR